MKWLDYAHYWPYPLATRIALPGLEPLVFRALPDTGSRHTVLPGRVVDAAQRLSTEGVVYYHRVQVVRFDRTLFTVELAANDVVRCRKWGEQEFRHHEVFEVSLAVGTGSEFIRTSVVFFPLDRDDEEPHIVLGRDFLFHRGGCCFDERKRRLKLSVDDGGACCAAPNEPVMTED